MNKKNTSVNIDTIINDIQLNFPFKNYFENGFSIHKSILNEIQKFTTSGAKILDLGCGACDKVATLSAAGYRCTGYDDFNDPWHRKNDNLNKIKNFASKFSVNIIEAKGKALPFSDNEFDAVILNDVIEHLHESPQYLLNEACRCIKKGGILLITVPNAVNIRKRLFVIAGKTNYPPFEEYFWNEGIWRGHIREYVKDDLLQLAKFMKLNIIQINSSDYMLNSVSKLIKPIFKAITYFAPGWKDSWLMICKKPESWTKISNQ